MAHRTFVASCGIFRCSSWTLLVVCRLQYLWQVDSLVVAHELWSTPSQQLQCLGSVALRYVGSSQSRDCIHVPCIAKQILNHLITREVLSHILLTASLLWPLYYFHISSLGGRILFEDYSALLYLVYIIFPFSLHCGHLFLKCSEYGLFIFLDFFHTWRMKQKPKRQL